MEGSEKPRVLIIGLTWPEPRASAAGLRTVQVIGFFLKKGYVVSVASAAGEPPADIRSELSGVDLIPISINHPSFDEWIATLAPDIVVFDRFITEEYFGWRVAENAPRALRVLDMQDIHSLRKTREEALTRGMPFSASLWKQSDFTKRELASLFRCDLSLVISAFEMEWLLSNSPVDSSLLFYLPFVFNDADRIPAGERLPFEYRKDFVFVGNGKHSANTDAIRFLKDELWPGIKKELPDARVMIYGASLPTPITELTSPENGFYVKGWVPEIREVVRSARVNLLPLRFGAGLKGKLFEAVLCGTPSVTTSIGAEGTPFSNIETIVGDDPKTFIAKAVELYSSKVLWQDVQKRGDAILTSDFAGKNFHDRLDVTFQNLRDDLPSHRENNLIGSMLLHHTMAGTKYLSKWIELKEHRKSDRL